MKKTLTLLLAMLLLAGSVLVSCKGSESKKKDDDGDTQIEDTTEQEEDEDTTEEETTDDETSGEDTAADTTAASDTTAQSGSGQQSQQGTSGGQQSSSQGSGGGSMSISGGQQGGSAQGGQSSSSGSQTQVKTNWDETVPAAAGKKDAFPATIKTRGGKSLIHTYSDRAVGGGEDNSTNVSYMPLVSTTVKPDPHGSYNAGRVIKQDIKPGMVSQGVIVGYDGYMFYGDTLNDFTGQGFLHQELYNHAAQMLKDRNKWAEDRGKKLYFVIAPNKNTVYPDYMPDYTRDGKATGYSLASYRRYDQFVALLKSAGITAVDLRETMNAAVRATPERNLYYKYDTHWNNHAGFLAYQTTMNMIKKDFPNVVIHSKNEYQINYCETYMKDQAYYLGYYDYFHDYGPVYTLKTGKNARLESYDAIPGWGQFTFAYECTSGPNAGYSDKLKKYKYTNDYNTSAPNVYIMRDSYSIAMVPFLKDSFHSSTYNWDFAFQESEIEKADADVILIIVAERNLRNYVNQKTVSD